jgi:hypothetical protein
MPFFVEEPVRIYTEGPRKLKKVKMRICNICNIEKDITEYNLRKEGKYKYKYCKSCLSIKRKASSKIYYEKNKEKLNEKTKKYYQENKEILNEKNKLYSENNKERRRESNKEWREDNKEILKKKSKEFRENNKELVKERKRLYYENLSVDQKNILNEKKKLNYHQKIEENRINKKTYVKERMNEPLFKLKFNIRALVRNALKRGFTEKSKRTQEIIGCSFEDFKLHLESQFDENMNWENQGSYWHMDHIIPISSAETKEEVYRLNHYTNFQPLYWLDNLKKSDKY